MKPETIIMAASLGAFALAVCNAAWLRLGEWSKWERCGRYVLPRSMIQVGYRGIGGRQANATPVKLNEHVVEAHLHGGHKIEQHQRAYKEDDASQQGDQKDLKTGKRR